MPRFMMLPVLLCIGQALSAQYVYTIKADSVKITNNCDTAELIIENHTQTVPGFLYNKGRGRTEFRRGAMAINDSLYLVGGDTINLYKGRVNVTASNGLNATNGHVKLGGQLTNKYTYIRFGPVSKEFSITSYDSLSQLLMYHDYNGEDEASINYLVYTSNLYTPNTHTSDASAGFSCSYGGFTAEAAGPGIRSAIVLDTLGFHVLNNRMTIGFLGDPTYLYGKAQLQIAPGTDREGSAPLKFSPGTLLTTLENNAVEFDGFDLFLTEHSFRYKLAKILDGQLTTGFGGSLSAFNSVTASLTVAGAKPGDVVNVSANSGVVNPPSIIITAYVTSANTVTLQAYNASNSAVNIASDTYKVRVIK
jgi:hypothetical protein